MSFLIPENSTQLSFKLRKFQSIFFKKKFIAFFEIYYIPNYFVKLDLQITILIFSISNTKFKYLQALIKYI
jgi:hypothetical protein